MSNKATVIAVVNQKGGTGKTTTCENLGIGLANELTANENGRGIARACEPWSELAGKWLNREFPWWNGAKIER